MFISGGLLKFPFFHYPEQRFLALFMREIFKHRSQSLCGPTKPKTIRGSGCPISSGQQQAEIHTTSVFRSMRRQVHLDPTPPQWVDQPLRNPLGAPDLETDTTIPTDKSVPSDPRVSSPCTEYYSPDRVK
jgi:hypothetical protein